MGVPGRGRSGARGSCTADRPPPCACLAGTVRRAPGRWASTACAGRARRTPAARTAPRFCPPLAGENMRCTRPGRRARRPTRATPQIISLPACAPLRFSGHFWKTELRLQAHRGHVLLPDLGELALVGLRLGVAHQHERRTVGAIAPAVAVAVHVAIEIEQRLRARRVRSRSSRTCRPGRSRRVRHHRRLRRHRHATPHQPKSRPRCRWPG